MGGVGYHVSLSEFFFAQCRKLSCGKQLFQKKTGTEKQLWLKGGGYHVSLTEFFCLTSPKNIVGEPLCVSEKSWFEKKLWIREGGRGGVSLFSV